MIYLNIAGGDINLEKSSVRTQYTGETVLDQRFTTSNYNKESNMNNFIIVLNFINSTHGKLFS